MPRPLSLDTVMSACMTWLPAGWELRVARSAGGRARRLLINRERFRNRARACTSREPW